MSQQAANQLEVWFSGMPEMVQSVLHEPFTWMNESLKSVSGDPQALMAAVPLYLRFADTVNQLADDQLDDRDQLSRVWSGDAYLAFDVHVGRIDDQLRKLADTMATVPELLENGANACAEAADIIIDLVVGLIMFVVSLFITNLALLIVTAGTVLAAFVATSLARVAIVMSRVTRVITKLSRLLRKISRSLTRLQERLDELTDTLKSLQDFLTDMKKDAKDFSGMEKIRRKGDFHTANGLVSFGINVGTLGIVSPPTTGSSVEDAAKDYYDAVRAAERADDVAERER
ncbi:MAG TPA: hypothetical protein VN408_11660 [Actinoplanes sp.]|nr:hypothetical protein [Actinoplanes sp.]